MFGGMIDFFTLFCIAFIFFYSTEDKQLQRLMTRDSSSPDEATSRIKSQMPILEKVHHATYAIDNNGSSDQLADQVDLFLKSMQKQVSWFWILHWLIPPMGIAAAAWVIVRKMLVSKVRKPKQDSKR